MVVFTCNACCATLKKNQVEKHCTNCRRCESLACVDCGKDFWGDDYKEHIKCITEEEKYHGKDHVPKVAKGETKQEQWVEKCQSAIDKASSKPKLKNVLTRLKDFPNIPRKKAKFENFVKNSLRINSPYLIAEVWEVLMENNSKNTNGSTEAQSSESQTATTNGHDKTEEDKDGLKEAQDDSTVANAPKNKREKKEERRKNAHKKEKKDKQVDNNNSEAEQDTKAKKKSKKRKRQESEQDENDDAEEASNSEQAATKKKKSKKNKATTAEVLEETADNEENGQDTADDDEEEEAPPAKKKKMKFNWDRVIKDVLKKKGELTLKKLKKKVLSEFAAQDAANYNEDNLSAKFDKKIHKTEGVKVSKDRACLK